MSAVTNTEIVVLWDKKNMKIMDMNGQLISELQELDEDERITWELTSCCLSRDQMAVLSQTDGQQKLSLWDVTDPFKVTRLRSQPFRLGLPSKCNVSMKMDEQFIVVSTSQNTATNIHSSRRKRSNCTGRRRLICYTISPLARACYSIILEIKSVGSFKFMTSRQENICAK
jgi:hypothetical protein